MPREFSAGVVIYRWENGNPQYLILQHERGHWDFVKGNVEKNEKIRDTIIRETQEETGSKIYNLMMILKKESTTFTRERDKPSTKKSFSI